MSNTVVCACASILVTIVAAGCHGHLKMTPKEIDEMSQTCRSKIDGGKSLAQRSERIGYRPGFEHEPAVVIYGAAWCDACHIAADYLTRRGIPHVDKDIELDDAVRAEMLKTMVSAGLKVPERAVDIPVVAARGLVTIGFNPCAIEETWGRGG